MDNPRSSVPSWYQVVLRDVLFFYASVSASVSASASASASHFFTGLEMKKEQNKKPISTGYGETIYSLAYIINHHA